jgi:hypothetical protein
MYWGSDGAHTDPAHVQGQPGNEHQLALPQAHSIADVAARKRLNIARPGWAMQCVGAAPDRYGKGYRQASSPFGIFDSSWYHGTAAAVQMHAACATQNDWQQKLSCTPI